MFWVAFHLSQLDWDLDRHSPTVRQRRRALEGGRTQCAWTSSSFKHANFKIIFPWRSPISNTHSSSSYLSKQPRTNQDQVTCSSTITSSQEAHEHSPPSPQSSSSPTPSSSHPQRSESPLLGLPGKGKRGRPRKHAPKLPLPPLYVFIRNLLHNPGYNPSVIAWVDDEAGCFKVSGFYQ